MAAMQPPRPCLPLPQFDPQTLLPRAFFERVPGAFYRSAQRRKRPFGQFFSPCKEKRHVFHAGFYAGLTTAGACVKALLHLRGHAGRSAHGGAVHKAVPKEKHRETRKTSAGNAFRHLLRKRVMKKDHSSFVYHCLRRCCCGYGSDRLRRRSLFHCGILCCGVHLFFCRC